MTKWEYRVEVIEVGGVKDQKMDRREPGLNNSWLNNIGEDGWELVNTTATNNRDGYVLKQFYLVFKRPVE